MKPRSFIARMSPKTLANKHGGRLPSSTITGPKKAPKRVNRKRKASEFARCYGSKERVQWVKARDCVACLSFCFPCENAHVEGDGGSRKANADKVVPLCVRPPDQRLGEGCHAMLHRVGVTTFSLWWDVDLHEEAKKTELAWQDFLAARTR